MLMFKCTTTLRLLLKADDNIRMHLAVILTFELFPDVVKPTIALVLIKGMNPPMR